MGVFPVSLGNKAYFLTLVTGNWHERNNLLRRVICDGVQTRKKNVKFSQRWRKFKHAG